MDCSVAQSLEIVGEWWSLLVVRDCFLGIRRFEEFQRHLGIARNVLTERLQRLVDEGVLERRAYQTNPERFEYRLTEKGFDLYPVIVALMRWGDKWANDGDGPVVLTHKACGHEGAPVLTCVECGEVTGARDMRYRVKPGRGPL